MSTSATLAELARQVRGDTQRMLEAAQPEWLTWSPPGTSNHILWHAGHAVWLQDLLCVQLLTGQTRLTSDWEATFGMHCRPPAQTTDWPSQQQLARQLDSQLKEILDLLSTTTGDRLAQIADPSRGPAPISSRIMHGWHDEAKHCGEMYLLLKLCRLGS